MKKREAVSIPFGIFYDFILDDDDDEGVLFELFYSPHVGKGRNRWF